MSVHTRHSHDDTAIPPMPLQLYRKLQSEGFFVPSVSANYRFFVTSAVPARVYLSTDHEDPQQAVSEIHVMCT